MSRVPSELSSPSTALLRARIRTLFRHLPQALGGDDEGIHQLRVASRRLRVGLPLLACRPESGRVQRTIRTARKIGRAAGPSRDLDVTLALLEETARAPEWDSPDTRLLRRRLRATRRRRCHAMSEGLLDLDIARFRADLRRIQGRGGETLFTTVSRLRRFRDAEGNGTLALLEEIGDRFDPVRLHRFRSRARRLRYAAEISAELRGSRTEAPKRLKRIQERLGEMHDAFVLSEWLGRQSEVARRTGRSSLSAMAGQLQAEFLKISRQHHRAFLEDDPAGTVRQALAEMFRADSAA